MNNYAWNNRNNRNVVYVNGRRGSRNSMIVSPTGTAGNTIINVNGINTPRLNNNPNNRIPRPYDVDIVENKPDRNFIERFIDKFENSGVKVRTYNNPNQYNNDQIIINNTRRGWKPESSNYGRGSWSGQNIPTQTTPTRQFNAIQSGQVRGRSGSPVPQQTGTSVNSSSQGRSSSGRIQN